MLEWGGSSWGKKAPAAHFGNERSHCPPLSAGTSQEPSSSPSYLEGSPDLPAAAPVPSSSSRPPPSRSSSPFLNLRSLVLQRLINHPLQAACCFLRPGVSQPFSPPTPGPLGPCPAVAGRSPHQHDHSPGAEDDAAGGQLGPTAQKRRHEERGRGLPSCGPSGKAARGRPG